MTARTFTPPCTDDEIASWLVGCVLLPLVEKLRNMAPLCVVEGHQFNDSTRFRRVIVGNCSLEPLSLRRRLSQLAAQPA
jgi:hypothetical protein